jgi:hypothetical protein
VPDAKSERHLFVAGVGQHLPVIAEDDREWTGRAVDLLQQCPSFGGIGGMERERETTPLKQVPYLV